MAKKKDNFKSLGDADLSKKISAMRENIRDIRFKGQGAKPKNVKEVRGLKREVARALTESNARAKNK